MIMKHLYEYSNFGDDLDEIRIITLGDLRELVDNKETHLIKMCLYSYGDMNNISIEDVKIDDRDGYTNVSWSWNGGDPDISLRDDDDLIKKEYHSGDSDYAYTLYLEHPLKITTRKYNI